MNGDNAKIFIQTPDPKSRGKALYFIIPAVIVVAIVGSVAIMRTVFEKANAVQSSLSVKKEVAIPTPLSIEETVSVAEMLTASNYFKKYLRANELTLSDSAKLAEFERGEKLEPYIVTELKDKAVMCIEYLKSITPPPIMHEHYTRVLKEQRAIVKAMQALQASEDVSSLRKDLLEAQTARRAMYKDPLFGLCIDYHDAFDFHANEGKVDEYSNINLLSDETLERIKLCVNAQRVFLLPNGKSLKETLRSKHLTNVHIKPKWFAEKLQFNIAMDYSVENTTRAISGTWLVNTAARKLEPADLDANLVSRLTE